MHIAHLTATHHLLRSLLFATTNHIERLDPALSRPGRMDVWINFTHATKWQAEGIFKCFFPTVPSVPAPEQATKEDNDTSATDASQKNLPGFRRKISKHAIPLLSETEIAELAKRFGEAIPEDELSVSILNLFPVCQQLNSSQVASLQGYLLKNKTRPRECVDEVGAWILQERETRAKIKAEKEKAEVC
jgi:mitochondrial chaperone BCS1